MHSAWLFTDGGSRNNPGQAAYAAVLTPQNQKNEPVAKLARSFGIATNNVAEYQGLIAGLKLAQQHAVQNLEVFLDSLLVVEQMKKNWKVKDADLRDLWTDAQALTKHFQQVTFHHIPREENYLADQLLNDELDKISN